MSNFKPKSNDQLRRIFGLAKPLGCGEDDLRELAADVTAGRVERLSLLSFDEANAMIQRLGGEPLPATAPTHTSGVAAAGGRGTPDPVLSTRMAQKARQKAGIKQIRTASQLELMHKLAEGRGISPEGLSAMCRRMLKGRSEPQTTEDTNKIIEALKAMNRRDSVKEAA